MFKAFSKLLVLCLVTASAVMAADTTGQAALGNVQSQVEAMDESDHVRRLGHHHARSPTATIEGIVLGTRGLETLASLVAAAGLGPEGTLRIRSEKGPGAMESFDDLTRSKLWLPSIIQIINPTFSFRQARSVPRILET